MDIIAQLKEENQRLRNENKRLKELLAQHGIVSKSVAQQRIELFRSFFKGREDVFAYRWMNKEGKKQYSPVVQEKYRYLNKQQRAAIKDDIYVGFTNQAVYDHLAGKASYGIYLIVDENQCHLAALDFDKEGYQETCSSVASTAKEYGFPYLIERSQSGKGCHLWFFFQSLVPAKKARQLCTSLLTRTMKKNPLLSMESYDRIFPSQDIVAKSGFGSLIALPLDGRARKEGNSVFVDESFQTYPDPWKVLSNTKKIHEEDIDSFLKNLGSDLDLGVLGTSQQNSWVDCDLDSLSIILDSGIHIPLSSLTPSATNQLKRLASFPNPEFYRAQQMRFSTWNIPRVICAAEQEDGMMILPRGCLTGVRSICPEITVDDRRVDERVVQRTFCGTLRSDQEVAVSALLAHQHGVLNAPTGFGKTVVAAYLISKLQQRTLIIVHTKPLLKQWVERLKTFLPHGTVGTLGGGKRDLSGEVDVAIINSLVDEPMITSYGLVLVDECHHAAARSYESVLKQVRAKYVYGLTATPMRHDGHHELIFMQCGPVIHTVEPPKQTVQGLVIPRYSLFRCDYHTLAIQEIYQKLTQNDDRNHIIAKDIAEHHKNGRSILVLSTRVGQLHRIEELLRSMGISALVMKGGQNANVKREVEEYLETMLNARVPALILATGKYIGEGFDFPRLDTLILAAPIAWKGNVIQYVGRVSRVDVNKKEILVIDYIDFKIPVFLRMFSKRLNAYKKIGFTLCADDQKPKEKLLFDLTEYRTALQKDLAHTKGEALFSLPFLSRGFLKKERAFVQELGLRGNVTFIVNEAYEELEQMGIKVQVSSEELINCVLIAPNIVWYGSVQMFGKSGAEDTMIRLEDGTYYDEFRGLMKDT